MAYKLISRLHHVELFSAKPEESVTFFTDVLGLQESARDGNSVYLRAWGEFFHHSLKITAGPGPGSGMRPGGPTVRPSSTTPPRRSRQRESGSLDRRRRRPWPRIPVLDSWRPPRRARVGVRALRRPTGAEEQLPEPAAATGDPRRSGPQDRPCDDGVDEADGGCVDVPGRPRVPVHGGNDGPPRHRLLRDPLLRAPEPRSGDRRRAPRGPEREARPNEPPLLLLRHARGPAARARHPLRIRATSSRPGR